MFDHLAVPNLDLGGYELAKMLVDVPLHGDFRSKLSPDILHAAVIGHPRIWVLLDVQRSQGSGPFGRVGEA